MVTLCNRYVPYPSVTLTLCSLTDTRGPYINTATTRTVLRDSAMYKHYRDHILPKGEIVMWKDILYTYLVGSTTWGRSSFGGLYLVRERLLTTMTGDRVRLHPGERHRAHRRETELWKLHHMGLPIENQPIWSINPSTRAHLKMGHTISNGSGTEFLH